MTDIPREVIINVIGDLLSVLENIPKFEDCDPKTFELDWNEWQKQLLKVVGDLRKPVEDTSDFEPCWELVGHPERAWGFAAYNNKSGMYWLGASGKKAQFWSDRKNAKRFVRELNTSAYREQTHQSQD